MTTAQPGQEQRMVTDAMIEAGRTAWQSAIKDRNLDPWLAHIYTVMHAARPTADLGADSDLPPMLYSEADQDDVPARLRPYLKAAADLIESLLATVDERKNKG